MDRGSHRAYINQRIWLYARDDIHHAQGERQRMGEPGGADRMAKSMTEVAVIGGGAAGIAAARRLRAAGVDCLIIEARDRLGGRAWTVLDNALALDLGCGWLHSADRNPWVDVAAEQARSIDKSPPPWGRSSLTFGFPLNEQRAFFETMGAFYTRLDRAAKATQDAAASTVLERNGRWNNLINAVANYITGADLDRVSIHDFDRFEDSGVNWRVAGGYGALIAAAAKGIPVAFDCPVRHIGHSGKRLMIETSRGMIEADRAIITLPSTVIAENEALFVPALPEKTVAALGLPLGLADKLFLSLEVAEEFEKDSRLFGRTDRPGTGGYHFRPFGRPQIEAYFGGGLAAELETQGEPAFFAFAVSELTGIFGNAFAQRLKPIVMHRWAADPWARGSYSCALPGAADGRAILAAPVDDRLFFAGEACSLHDFSTAHGAFLTGVAAAEQAIAARVGKSVVI
jgi:monoamine oxidase